MPFPPLEDLPNPGFKPESPVFQADYLPSELLEHGMLKNVISRTQSTSRVRIPNWPASNQKKKEELGTNTYNF